MPSCWIFPLQVGKIRLPAVGPFKWYDSMPQVPPISECKVLVLALALTEFPAILLENFMSKVQIIDDFLWKNPFFPYSMT